MGGVSFVCLYFLSLAVSFACSTEVLSEWYMVVLLCISVTDVIGGVAESWCRYHLICLCAFLIFSLCLRIANSLVLSVCPASALAAANCAIHSSH